MTKHVFIINPTSGDGKYREVLKLIEENFLDSPLNFETRTTEYVQHATEIAQEYSGDVVLYSVGGDGTAHEILNGIQPGVEMAVIPVGTGNDFWRMVNFEGSLKDILYETIQGQTIEIDIGLTNGRRFLNMASIGFDAQINKRVNDENKRFIPRQLVYLITAVRELTHYKASEIEIELDGEKADYKILLSSFMNGKWYGGGFMSAPHASLTDRKLDVCLVEDMPVLKILKMIPRYMKGKHLDLEEVTYKQVSNIKLKSDKEILISSDGELFTFKEIEIKLDSERLKLRLPKKAVLRQ